ncbi:glycosyltransferase family 87 protein [Luteococcus sp. H138]|uniref:glycosyltransferase family 87 protein n=1 Tax=unclassified Luteococcus TaxID=2639923 RepID=UPI00313B42C0
MAVQEPARRPILWGAAAWLLLWAIVAGMVLRNLASPTDAVGLRYDYADFRDTTWTPLQDFLRGQLPWETADYQLRHPNAQPFLLYVPHYFALGFLLLMLPYPAAVGLWIGLTTASVAMLVTASMWRWLPGVARRAPWVVLPLSCFFALTPPGKYGLFTGNWVTVCAPAAAALVLVRRPWSVAGALFLSVVKPQVGVPASLMALGWGRWKGVLMAAGASLLLVLPVMGVAVRRAGGVGPFIDMLGRNLQAADQELSSNALPQVDTAHLLGQLGAPGPLVLAGGLVVALAVGLLGLWAGRRAPGSAGQALGLGLFVLLALPNLLYTALVLVPAIAGLVAEVGAGLRDRGSDGRWRAPVVLRLLLLGLLLFPFVNFYRLFPLLGYSVAVGYLVNAICLNLAALVAPLTLRLRCGEAER